MLDPRFVTNDLYLVSFGGGSKHMRSAVKRLKKEGLESEYFKEIYIHTDKTIYRRFPSCKGEISQLSGKYKKGFGLYLWKIHLIKETLATIPPDSILLYLDAGCHINSKSISAKKNMDRYKEILKSQAVLAFQIKDYQFRDQTNFSEKFWSKPELTECLKLNDSQINSNQIESGVIFIRNCEIGRDFLINWLDLARRDNYNFILDDPIWDCNQIVGHNRHDQSVFSCLYKKNKLFSLPNETYFADSWEAIGVNFPIWTIRNRTGISADKRIDDLPQISLLYMANLTSKIWCKLKLYFRI